MSVAQKISTVMQQSSWIRKMFEEGGRLKAQYGADKVFDFSLGNPNLPPPAQFNEALQDAVSSCGLGDHCYMPQAGYPQVCDARGRVPDGRTGRCTRTGGHHHDLRGGWCFERDSQVVARSGRRSDRADPLFCRIQVLCGQSWRRDPNGADPARFFPGPRCHRGGRQCQDKGGPDQFAQQPHRADLHSGGSGGPWRAVAGKRQ